MMWMKRPLIRISSGPDFEKARYFAFIDSVYKEHVKDCKIYGITDNEASVPGLHRALKYRGFRNLMLISGLFYYGDDYLNPDAWQVYE